jgi:hypothetical protein
LPLSYNWDSLWLSSPYNPITFPCSFLSCLVSGSRPDVGSQTFASQGTPCTSLSSAFWPVSRWRNHCAPISRHLTHCSSLMCRMTSLKLALSPQVRVALFFPRRIGCRMGRLGVGVAPNYPIPPNYMSGNEIVEGSLAITNSSQILPLINEWLNIFTLNGAPILGSKVSYHTGSLCTSLGMMHRPPLGLASCGPLFVLSKRNRGNESLWLVALHLWAVYLVCVCYCASIVASRLPSARRGLCQRC